MIALLRGILGVFITVCAILFAIANREAVPVVWSPAHDPVTLPACFLGLGGAAVGFLLGCGMVWLNNSATRRERRQQRKTIRSLERQLDATAHETVR